MTTNNHTVAAVTIAILSQNADPLGKAIVLTALVLSHIPFDAIPHGHYYEFERLKKTGQERFLNYSSACFFYQQPFGLLN